MRRDLLAEDIAEELLYRTGQALAGRNENGATACFAIPFLIDTAYGQRLIETEDAVREIYAHVRTYLAENDVTDVVRTVHSAEFLAPDIIGTIHVSQLMKSDGTAFRRPYPVYSVLHKSGRVWRIASSTYAILDAPEHNAVLAGVVGAAPG